MLFWGRGAGGGVGVRRIVTNDHGSQRACSLFTVPNNVVFSLAIFSKIFPRSSGIVTNQPVSLSHSSNCTNNTWYKSFDFRPLNII